MITLRKKVVMLLFTVLIDIDERTAIPGFFGS